MAKRKPKPAKPVDAAAPNAQQQARAEFIYADVVDNTGGGATRIGKGYRRVRMVEHLQLKGIITADEAKALRHYRHHADLEDRSPVRDSLNQQRGGNGNGPGVELLNACRLVADVETAVGSLRGILRAVVVDDVPLREWAMQIGGSIDDCRWINGVAKCTVRPRHNALEMARLDIRIAAQRVKAELEA